jgi:glycosyltransferase involved in cell wall biosynthesis
MKVIIVIPAYNEENRIADTLTAILAQDYNNFDIVVVNNASTDRTAEIAAKFPVLVVNEPKKGLPFARESGRKAIEGSDLIANIDADCIPEKDWLSRGVSFFNDPKVVAVSGPYDYYDLTPSLRKFLLFTFIFLSRPLNTLLQLPYVELGGVLVGGNNIIRTAVLKKMGGYNTDILFHGEDTDTAKRVSKHGHIIFNRYFLMKTSGRRFKEEGVLKLSSKYLKAYFSARK